VKQAGALSLGETHPSDRKESEVSGAIWDYVVVETLRYKRLVPYPDIDEISVDDKSMIMTDRLALKIKQLSDAFSTKDELDGKYRLFVKQAYTEYSQGAAKPISPLLYEGRAAIFSLKKIGGGGAPSTAAMEALAERATLLFDYVHYYKSDEIQVSVIESSCNAKIDLAFLIDGSDSINPSDFHLAKEFIGTVAQRFDLERGTQQLAMTMFSGWFLRVREEAGVEYLPTNSDGKTCKSGYFCDYDAAVDKSNPACTRCIPKLSHKCPEGTLWLRNSNGLDYCACRNSCDKWEEASPATYDATCEDTRSNPQLYSGCFPAKVTYRFTKDGQSAGQCYQENVNAPRIMPSSRWPAQPALAMGLAGVANL